jgi:hypothetical protein
MLSMVVHACNTSSRKAEVGGLRDQSKLEMYIDLESQKTQINIKQTKPQK